MERGSRVALVSSCFCCNDTATTEIYTLSLHDALPISPGQVPSQVPGQTTGQLSGQQQNQARSAEHTSELQSHQDIVCRLLLEKKKHWRLWSIPPLHKQIVVIGPSNVV